MILLLDEEPLHQRFRGLLPSQLICEFSQRISAHAGSANAVADLPIVVGLDLISQWLP